MKTEKLVTRWEAEGIIDHSAAARILEFESKRRGPFAFGTMLICMAVLAIFLGIAAIVGANWHEIPASLKLCSHMTLDAVVALALFRLFWQGKEKTIAAELLIGLMAGLTLSSIALVGQVYQSHEPTSKALVLWLAITTPFWLFLRDSKGLARLWLMSFLFTWIWLIGPFGEANVIKGDLAQGLWLSLLPIGMIALGQHPELRKLRPVNFGQISSWGFGYIFLATSIAQMLWYLDTKEELRIDTIAVAVTPWVTLLAAILLIQAHRRKRILPLPKEAEAFLVISVVFSAAPFLIPHEIWSVASATLLMAYWALCGWLGAKAGYSKAINAASILIAIRLVIVYIEVFGSLLSTGVGLIASGVVLMAVVWATRRAIAHLKPAA